MPLSMIRENSNHIATVLYHTLFWAVYVLSEYLANYPHLKGSEHFQQVWTVLISLPLLMVPTYIIVLVAVPKFLKQNKNVAFSLILLACAAFVFYGRIIWLELINYIIYDFSGSMPASKVVKNVVRDYAIIALATAIYIINDWRRKEKENKELVEAKAKSDLELLKRQLHPHFLFNTLNNIYSLSLKNSKQTGESILKLSKLLEYLVYRSGEKNVLLEEELELVRNYIDLEKLHYGDELNLVMEVEGIDNKLKIAPLILLPFVENCFKHGGKNEKGVFWIKIRIKMFAGLLTVFIENSKPAKKKVRSDSASGVGLSNIDGRLELLYHNKYILDIEDRVDFYSIKLELNL